MPGDNLSDTEILPVRCPRCGEAQNTSDGTTDPTGPGAQVGCMVCGHVFAPDEYRRLLEERRLQLDGLEIGDV